MIGAVEKEFRPAGNGAEPPDDQPFAVNRIMIQHIILFKESRIGHEVVVNGVVANFDGRSCTTDFRYTVCVSPVRGYIFEFIFSSQQIVLVHEDRHFSHDQSLRLL